MESYASTYRVQFPASRAAAAERLMLLLGEAQEIRASIRANERLRLETWASKVHQRYGQGDSAKKAGDIALWASHEAKLAVGDLEAELEGVEAETRAVMFLIEHDLIL